MFLGPDGNPQAALWRELEAGYALRARLLNHPQRPNLDPISEGLLNDTIFELQELEFAHVGSQDELEPNDLERAVNEARALCQRLEVWLERLDGGD